MTGGQTAGGGGTGPGTGGTRPGAGGTVTGAARAGAGGAGPGAGADAEQRDRLLAAVRRRFGSAARIDNLAVSTAGGINLTQIFDVVDGAGTRRVVSRLETRTEDEAVFLTSAEQYRVMQHVYRCGFPVPEPLFEYDAGDGLGRGYVTAFVAGETLPRAVQTAPALATARPRLAAQCGELLARLHALDASALPFLAARPDSSDAVGAFLDRFDSYAEAHPAIEAGFRWLARHLAPGAAPTLLHGDFRCGNLMVQPGGIVAVLDWECAHTGSPMEDLGWLCTRSWRFGRPDLAVGGFGERADLYAAYEAAGGRRVDRDEARAWEVFGIVRCAVYDVWQAHGHVTGRRRSVAYAVCGRNTSLVEYDLLMTLAGHYQ